MGLAKRLIHAAEIGDTEAVRSLLAAGADPNAPDEEGQVALKKAAAGGHEAIVRLLIERGADVNWADDGEFTTALMSAAANGHLGVLRLLLENGARVDDADDYGETSLCRALSCHHVEAVRLLLEHGADPKKPGELGTPLELAAQANNPALIALLRAAGA